MTTAGRHCPKRTDDQLALPHLGVFLGVLWSPSVSLSPTFSSSERTASSTKKCVSKCLHFSPPPPPPANTTLSCQAHGSNTPTGPLASTLAPGQSLSRSS